MNKILLLINIFFVFLGIILFSLLIHELTHIIMAKEPNSICYNFNPDLLNENNQRIVAYVSVNDKFDNKYMLDNWIFFTERIARISEAFVLLTLGFFSGVLINKFR